ncbi:MAG: hypothetical protein CMM56_02735 [Rhodospirillaceae bacterium]|nr:hypothetical protein [Rhodospirillaceae bacterium]|tara:strand:+ start:193 stop:480 length:288 start_codon:yes stop_codon:yes gene_type:complete
MRQLSPKAKQELKLAIVLIGIGFFTLPPAVYIVGQHVVGEYSAESGLWGLTSSIWFGVITANPMALLLVLSPYLITRILRWSLWFYKNNKLNKFI